MGAQQRWSSRRILAARVVAIAADALQLGLFPIFAEGIVSPLQAGLDVLVCAVLTFLLGWSWLFLPTFVAEAIPLIDVCPTWTAAVFFVTRKSRREVPGAPPARGETPREP